MKGKKLSARERLAKLEKDKEFRRKIFKELCSHVSQGYSVDCFYALSYPSITHYLKTYPEEFIEEELIEAKRLGQGYWEGLGRRQADGTCLGNSRTWYYNMSNRYGWRDKVEVEAEHKGNVSVNIVNYGTSKGS